MCQIEHLSLKEKGAGSQMEKNEGMAADTSVSSKTNLACFLCGLGMEDIKKLKFHLVLAHPKSNICLFCIEKKGWSSEFPSQIAYNDHYKEIHTGVIQQRAEEREERRRKDKARKLGLRQEKLAEKKAESMTRRLKDPRTCVHCPKFPVFETGVERDRHLVSEHNYDICRVCSMLGPGMEVMVHTAIRHPDQLCHLCGSQSPMFTSKARVKAHMENNHGQSGFFCPNCDNIAFPNLEEWLLHFESKHNCSGERLNKLNRRRSSKRCGEGNGEECLQPISGLRNESHRDCHILSVLHVLAQTSLPGLLQESIHFLDPDNLPELHHFFEQYKAGQAFFPHLILRNSTVFGVQHFPDLPGDLLRVFLKSCSSISDTFRSIIEWKFECSICRRFVKSRLDDFILRIPAVEASSFEQHISSFLTCKTCSCGSLCLSSPNVRMSGDFLFIELDRRRSRQVTPSGEEFEISLYPLKLRKSYRIFEETYSVMATINLNLDYAEGGHYSVNLLVGRDEVVRLHEDSVQKQVISPTFDSATVLVLLKKEASEAEVSPLLSGIEKNVVADGNISLENTTHTLPDAIESVECESQQEVMIKDVAFSPVESETTADREMAQENPMLRGDNLRIYLNDNDEIVERYRREYQDKVEKEMNAGKNVIEDVSLKSLGGQVLESKIYKVQSLVGSKKRRKKFVRLNSDMIDDDRGSKVEMNNELQLNIPEEIGKLR